jgi:hypothetical protein
LHTAAEGKEVVTSGGRMARKQSVTTEELAKRIVDEISTRTLEQKADIRAAFRTSNLSSLAGRAEHLHGLAGAAQLIQSEEACFREVMDFFEKLKTEDVKYKM